MSGTLELRDHLEYEEPCHLSCEVFSSIVHSIHPGSTVPGKVEFRTSLSFFLVRFSKSSSLLRLFWISLGTVLIHWSRQSADHSRWQICFCTGHRIKTVKPEYVEFEVPICSLGRKVHKMTSWLSSHAPKNYTFVYFIIVVFIDNIRDWFHIPQRLVRMITWIWPKHLCMIGTRKYMSGCTLLHVYLCVRKIRKVFIQYCNREMLATTVWPGMTENHVISISHTE